MISHYKFYVVWVGRRPGIYDNWDECKKQTDKYPGSKYKGCKTYFEAQELYRQAPPIYSFEKKVGRAYSSSPRMANQEYKADQADKDTSNDNTDDDLPF
jgi:ribonuclease HI